MRLTPGVLALAAAILIALGWFGHGAFNGPAPDVAELLKEARAKAGAEAVARETAARRADSVQIAGLQRSSDSAASVARLAKARAAVAGRQRDSAELRTDAALELLAGAGLTVDSVRSALVRERAATRRKEEADSIAYAAKQTEADSLARLGAVLLAGRARDSTRIDELTGLGLRLTKSLARASKRGLDPAATISYGVGCNNVTIGGSVRVLGWLRGGVHVETKECAR